MNESGTIGKAHHNVLSGKHTTRVFLICCVKGCASSV